MRTKLNQVNPIKLDDCFTKDNDLALMNGVQALVRLLIEQAKLDKKNGLVTNGYVSGYPGSPLGNAQATVHLNGIVDNFQRHVGNHGLDH